MAITFTCQCGQRLSARDEAQGRATKCPKCGAKLIVPHAEPATPQTSHPPPSSPPPLHGTAGRAAAPPTVPLPAAPSPAPQTPAPLHARPDRRGWIIADTGLAICYWALIVGGVAFGIIAVLIVVGVADPGTLVSVFGGPGTGRFVAMILPWCALGWVASWVALVTGWFVCCGVPQRTGAGQLIQGSVACVGIALGLVVLLQVVSLVMMPSTPDLGDAFGGPEGAPFGARRPLNPAEMQKIQETQPELLQAMRKRAEAASTVAKIAKVLTWLSGMAFITSTRVVRFVPRRGRSALAPTRTPPVVVRRRRRAGRVGVVHHSPFLRSERHVARGRKVRRDPQYGATPGDVLRTNLHGLSSPQRGAGRLIRYVARSLRDRGCGSRSDPPTASTAPASAG